MKLLFIFYMFVAFNCLGQTKKIVILSKLNYNPVVNVSVYNMDGDILAVSNKYGEIYFYNDIQVPDKVFISKENICDTFITNFSIMDTLFVQYPCYSLSNVNIKGSKIGLKKYWKQVHCDSVNKQIGIGDTVLFYNMSFVIDFVSLNKRFDIEGVLAISVVRLSGRLEIKRIDYYFESMAGDSILYDEYFFEIFPRFPIEGYFRNYSNLLLVDNITKGTREKEIRMKLGKESKKEFIVCVSNEKNRNYLYSRDNKLLTYIQYTSDSTSLSYGLSDYSSVIVNYSISKPRQVTELSTVLCTRMPNKRNMGSLYGSVYIVKMHLISISKPKFDVEPIEWSSFSTYIELINKIRNQ